MQVLQMGENGNSCVISVISKSFEESKFLAFEQDFAFVTVNKLTSTKIVKVLLDIVF